MDHYKKVADGRDDVTVCIYNKGLTADITISQLEFVHNDVHLGK